MSSMVINRSDLLPLNSFGICDYAYLRRPLTSGLYFLAILILQFQLFNVKCFEKYRAEFSDNIFKEVVSAYPLINLSLIHI